MSWRDWWRTTRSARAATLPATDDPVRAAKSLLEATAEGQGAGVALLVTLGPTGGVLVRRDAPPVDIKAPKVKAIDATGAGDSLNGALAAALAGGLGLEAAGRRAVVAASISVTRAGAREGMPTASELDAKLIDLGLMAPPAPEPDPVAETTDAAAGADPA